MLADLSQYPPGIPNGERKLCPVTDCGWYLDVAPPVFDPPDLRVPTNDYRLTVTYPISPAAVDAACLAHLRGHTEAELGEELVARLRSVLRARPFG